MIEQRQGYGEEDKLDGGEATEVGRNAIDKLTGLLSAHPAAETLPAAPQRGARRAIHGRMHKVPMECCYSLRHVCIAAAVASRLRASLEPASPRDINVHLDPRPRVPTGRVTLHLSSPLSHSKAIAGM